MTDGNNQTDKQRRSEEKNGTKVMPCDARGGRCEEKHLFEWLLGSRLTKKMDGDALRLTDSSEKVESGKIQLRIQKDKSSRMVVKQIGC